MKNNRPWLGETGVASRGKPRISKSRSEQIVLILKKIRIAPSDAKPFLKELAQNIGNYDARLKLREKCKPAEVRKNIKSALSALDDYNESLNQLDGISWQILGDCIADSQDVLRKPVSEAMQILNKAHLFAQSLPKRGALPDYPRLHLAIDVAYAVENLLACPISKKRGGGALYEHILAVVLEDATDRPVEHVTDLAKRARKLVKQTGRGGVLQYKLGSQ